jgi:two-component system, OmpR family, sensor histidine kinase BaeS
LAIVCGLKHEMPVAVDRNACCGGQCEMPVAVDSVNSITTRLIAAMLLVALATIGIPAAFTLFSAENQFKQPNERKREFSEVFRSVEILCRTKPPMGLVCPTPRDDSIVATQIPSNSQPLSAILAPPIKLSGGRSREPNRNPIFAFVDPRPWVQQTVLFGVGISLVMAVGLALLLSRRISYPIQLVSLAAAKVAKGDLSARAKVSGQDELGRLAENFNQMALGLEQQATARQNLFADIAHELRTPLTAIKARLEALEDGVMPLEMEAILRLSNQTKLLERLVEDLRLLSLADANALTLEHHPTDLTSVAKDTLEHFQAKAELKNIRLEFHAHSQLILPLDSNRIQQAIGNLLENALTHTPSGGSVSLTLLQHLDQAEIQIADTGSGIPPDALDRIFERLYRADASRNRSTGGSGLGLAIVKTITELHQGTVKASNRPEGGAVFSLRLPL